MRSRNQTTATVKRHYVDCFVLFRRRALQYKPKVLWAVRLPIMHLHHSICRIDSKLFRRVSNRFAYVRRAANSLENSLLPAGNTWTCSRTFGHIDTVINPMKEPTVYHLMNLKNGSNLKASYDLEPENDRWSMVTAVRQTSNLRRHVDDIDVNLLRSLSR